MKRLRDMIFLPPEANKATHTAHHIWLSAGLTGLGCCIGLLTLLLGATAFVKLPGAALFVSYLKHPLLLGLNLLPPVVLIWLFYLLSGRAWVGYLGSFVPCVLIALVNYYKIRLRGDPLLGADLLLASEATGIVGHYTLDLTWVVWTAIGCFVLGLAFAILLLPRGVKSKKVRMFGALGCILALVGAYFGIYTSSSLYNKTANNDLINPWSDVELFVSKGVLYPFLYSVQDMFPEPPADYDKGESQALLAQYSDADIPEHEKVDVVGVMLEAFCDLTDFPALAALPEVQEVYAPWHALEAGSVHGDLLTNIFAGGTVDSEWCFLTGYSQYDQFRSATDSYVWYFRDQGYDAVFHHPGYNWFYNRQNVNEYLGFQESLFTENCFGELVDPVTAVWDSDEILVDQLLSELEEGREAPYFSFSVSYQNHGPYSADPSQQPRLTSAETGWSQESCDILGSYLNGVEDTIAHMTRMVEEIERLDQPTVVVLFGDHKPWMGNGDSVYLELGVDFDRSQRAGFENYYGTPYLIWANSAAKEVLDADFVGEGGDFSPCFLMPKLFDLCGWEGPGFMQLSRQMRSITPLVHARGLFLKEEELTDALSPEEGRFYLDFLGAQYYRETEIDPKA